MADTIVTDLPGPGRLVYKGMQAGGYILERLVSTMRHRHDETEYWPTLGGDDHSYPQRTRAMNLPPTLSLSNSLSSLQVPPTTTDISESPPSLDQADSDYKWVLLPKSIHTSNIRSPTTSTPRFDLPSLPAVRSRYRISNHDDPEILVSSANHRFHAWFDLRDYPGKNSKKCAIIDKMRFEVAPFHVARSDGRITIRRAKDDRLYHELSEFIYSMDCLLSEFIWHQPDVVYTLSKRHANDILDMFDTPVNKEWITDVKNELKEIRRLMRLQAND